MTIDDIIAGLKTGDQAIADAASRTIAVRKQVTDLTDQVNKTGDGLTAPQKKQLLLHLAAMKTTVDGIGVANPAPVPATPAALPGPNR